MKQIFADTFYWIALINPSDDRHREVVQITSQLEKIQIITTDEVLSEVLNFLSGYGLKMRRRTVQLVKDIMDNPLVTVIQQTRESFLEGLNLYESRLDKEYSLTDCISMQTMKHLRIDEVLTHDKHFTQEGFKILL